MGRSLIAFLWFAPIIGRVSLVCSLGKVAGGEDTIEAAAAKCVGYVGADLAALAREAALAAARQVENRKMGARSICLPHDVAVFTKYTWYRVFCFIFVFCFSLLFFALFFFICAPCVGTISTGLWCVRARLLGHSEDGAFVSVYSSSGLSCHAVFAALGPLESRSLAFRRPEESSSHEASAMAAAAVAATGAPRGVVGLEDLSLAMEKVCEVHQTPVQRGSSSLSPRCSAMLTPHQFLSPCRHLG